MANLRFGDRPTSGRARRGRGHAFRGRARRELVAGAARVENRADGGVAVRLSVRSDNM